MARSAAAMVKGYQEFDPELNLAGVIFNKIGSKAHTQWLTDAVHATGVQTKVFGGIPKVCWFAHNCLYTPQHLCTTPGLHADLPVKFYVAVQLHCHDCIVD